MPGKRENKESVKGMMSRMGNQAGAKSIKSMEHVGSSDSDGIRFKAFSDHPDHSVVRSPEKK